MVDSDAPELLREAQYALIEAMKTGDLGRKEAEIDHIQEKLEDYAIDLEQKLDELPDQSV